MKKIIRYFLLFVVLGIAALLCFVKFAMPNVGDPEDIVVERTSQRIERGKYLANHVALCIDCHSTRDWREFSGPIVEGTLGKGGQEFNQKFGFPGSFYAKNITPFALKDWTDGEILRAVASGVNKDGKALFPVMPHGNYGKMDIEDLYSIIAYIRSLAPIENVVPDSEPDFPMNFIVNTLPQKAEYSEIPNSKNQVAYGAYLFNTATCAECHTKQEKGRPIEGMELAGDFEFRMPMGGTVRSSNITPDKETGIGNWSEAEFVERFKSYDNSTYTGSSVRKSAYNSMMPWTTYAHMKTEDLKAIYAFLKTQKPIKNKIEKFSE